MSGTGEGGAPMRDGGAQGEGAESLAEVLASIRALVSAESQARIAGEDDTGKVLMLTPRMRVDIPARAHSGEILSEGLDTRALRLQGAPILDEEALRDVVNSIVREELQGELGDRISRNLRKLIRRELSQMLEERREP
ncbi:MAG TPA: hypothetical protein PKA33_17970 [Amaricoccus sp.]|uniref:hypothetical protein n=1 Tax=Amaricoccus sp. TaxID=1872485 RepID=UPI002B8F3002|nr:hypothetical protein [Amaricoccus sp.]HMR54221.1 hypothetical protein [Amaricoccus sp.]HMR60085.1 hypothetical protein [Amaricoccus sp.]HMU01235.1 hypothetical protein [Amaricoccus sp.]